MNTKVTTCMTWSAEIMSLVLSHGLKEHNSHYADIKLKLNKHWYSAIASREFSVQCDESDNHITVTEDAALNQSLKNENISIEKLQQRWESTTIYKTSRIYKCRHYWHWMWLRYWPSWRANCSQLQARINRWPFT